MKITYEKVILWILISYLLVFLGYIIYDGSWRNFI